MMETVGALKLQAVASNCRDSSLERILLKIVSLPICYYFKIYKDAVVAFVLYCCETLSLRKNVDQEFESFCEIT
jgi:hypothetical protein